MCSRLIHIALLSCYSMTCLPSRKQMRHLPFPKWQHFHRFGNLCCLWHTQSNICTDFPLVCYKYLWCNWVEWDVLNLPMRCESKERRVESSFLLLHHFPGTSLPFLLSLELERIQKYHFVLIDLMHGLSLYLLHILELLYPFCLGPWLNMWILPCRSIM